MEISKLSQKGIKVKSKLITLAVTPFNAKGKVAIDCVLLYTKNENNLPTFETQPLIVDGPGEYEIKGAKFSGVGKKENTVYLGKLDGIDTVIMQASTAQKGKEMIHECQLAILEADAELDESTITAFSASAIVLYGEFAESISKKIGKNVITSSKYQALKDKLPTDTEVILLE